jgi:hypothetical protein
MPTKFVPNSITRRCTSGITLFDFNANLAPTLMQIDPNSTKKEQKLHHFIELMQISCQKGVSTKMHECLVGLF